MFCSSFYLTRSIAFIHLLYLEINLDGKKGIFQEILLEDCGHISKFIVKNSRDEDHQTEDSSKEQEKTPKNQIKTLNGTILMCTRNSSAEKKTESNINYLEIYSIVWAYIFG